MLQLAQRIYNLLDEIKAESDSKTYILVAHNGISRVIQSYFYDMTNAEYAAFGVKNCEVLRYDFGTFTIKNNTNYLSATGTIFQNLK
jgi:probable phosphoglycerate mutase